MKMSNVYSNPNSIKCGVCGKELMDNPSMSMINIIENMKTDKITKVIPCCKGVCDRKVQMAIKEDEVSGWKDITEFSNPYLYITNVMAVLNNMYDGKGFENKEAFEDYKSLLVKMYPYITRDMTEEELQEAILDSELPIK